MNKNAWDAEEVEDPETDVAPLTAEQAREWRERNPPMSPWWVVGGQIVAGLLTALLGWVLTGKPNVAWSAGYGAMAVALPAAVFARGMGSRLMTVRPNTASFGFFVWELIKLVLTVAMLLLAPRLITALSWLAMLAGLVMALQAYWVVALAFQARQRKTSE